jgi:spore maturation protein CgeB
MLAERTGRHLSFFEEGIEAEFFSSNQELLEKVRIFLRKDLEREKIAMAGYQRCIKSGYSMRSQLSSMLAQTTNV